MSSAAVRAVGQSIDRSPHARSAHPAAFVEATELPDPSDGMGRSTTEHTLIVDFC
ncbi:hypothetical protein IU449_10840 [Nocardia higoensis]|uniref:Uncharacterized protein n=1 Tax=Nocardia higoensis TaxID=228599 RepID=A0ABS0DDQ1_9NOCA|nr:hypothetical protein [Nocardia higoensis]MBF6355034.1 hypothetical protein [Nocardia higoensis]